MDPRTIEISRLRARNDYLNETIDALRAERARLAPFGLDLGSVELAASYLGASPLNPPADVQRGIGLVPLPFTARHYPPRRSAVTPLSVVGAPAIWPVPFAGVAHGPYATGGLLLSWLVFL